MNLFMVDKCPLCRLPLKKQSFSRHDNYSCAENCYKFRNLYELNARTCWVKLDDFSIQCIEAPGELTMHVYAANIISNVRYSGCEPIMSIPFIDFQWDDLKTLNKRIKGLVVFS